MEVIPLRSAQFVKIAKSLADPTRTEIVRKVREAGELNCSQICEGFECSQPTISHHIRTLHDAGVIKVRKQGTYHRLSVDEALLREFAAEVSGESPRPVAKPRRRSAAASGG